MTNWLRAVLDTNVFVSAVLSRSPTSPTKELSVRGGADVFKALALGGWPPPTRLVR